MKRKVMYVSWEDTIAGFLRRLPDSFRPDSENIIEHETEENLYVAEAGIGSLWHPGGGSQHIATTVTIAPFGEWLVEAIKIRKPKLVIIDPVAAAYLGSENDRSLVRKFLTYWREVAKDNDCAILIVAHPAKSQDSEYSGSTDWVNGVRFAWSLSAEAIPMKDPRQSYSKKKKKFPWVCV